MANNILSTGQFNLSDQLAGTIIDKVQTGSVVTQLSGAKPQQFGNVSIIKFTANPRAEFVEEGAQKSPASVGLETVTALPHKAQVTMRFDQEVQFYDESRLNMVLSQLADKGAVALARALDLGVLHGINPSSGAAVASMAASVNKTTMRVARTASASADLESAIGMLMAPADGSDGVLVGGVAASPNFTYSLATEKDKTGHILYPTVSANLNTPSVFNGFPLKGGSTVSAMPEGAGKYGVDAIVGDWSNGIYWGIQEQLPVDVITYGDPDGLGDLKRQNQIALRLEVVYGWYADPTRFAVVDKAAASASE